MSLSPAQRLAAMINTGIPSKTSTKFTFDELQSALGTIEITELGWRKRVGSFLEYLVPNLPENYNEEDLEKHIDESFTTPLLIKRREGGVASYLAKRLKKKNMMRKNPSVRPSRCSSLAVNYNDNWPAFNPTTKNWDRRLQPFQKCPECPITFQRLYNLSMRTFDLQTKASDNGNIQLQTHGIKGKQLKPLKILFKRHRSKPHAMYSVKKKFFLIDLYSRLLNVPLTYISSPQ